MEPEPVRMTWKRLAMAAEVRALAPPEAVAAAEFLPSRIIPAFSEAPRLRTAEGFAAVKSAPAVKR
jgi:hypothetical protein